MGMKVNTILISGGTAVVAFCVAVYMTKFSGMMNATFVAFLGGERVAEIVVKAILVALPVCSAAAVKLAYGDRLAGWLYVLIPVGAVLGVAYLAAWLFIQFLFLPSMN